MFSGIILRFINTSTCSRGGGKGQLCAGDRKLHSRELTVCFLLAPFDVRGLNAAWKEKFNSFKTFCVKVTCFNVFSSDVSIIFSSHDGEGGGGEANLFVVKVPKQNFKQRSGRRDRLNVRVAFKSKNFFFSFPVSWLSETCKLRRFIAALPNASLELRVQISEIPEVLRGERGKGK